jgi:hypothetical protein
MSGLILYVNREYRVRYKLPVALEWNQRGILRPEVIVLLGRVDVPEGIKSWVAGGYPVSRHMRDPHPGERRKRCGVCLPGLIISSILVQH